MDHISKSQLEELMNCPKAYWFHRFQGLGWQDSPQAALGRVYHAVQEKFFRNKMATGKNQSEEWYLDTFSDLFDAEIQSGLEAETLEFAEGQDVEAKNTGIGLLKAYYPYALALEPLMVEKRYEIALPGIDFTLYGIIDLVYKRYLVDASKEAVKNEETGLPQHPPILDKEGLPIWKAVVVDHKTTGSSPYAEDNPKRMQDWMNVHQYSHEAIGYVLAYRAISGQEEDSFEYQWAVKLKTPKIIVSTLRFKNQHLNWFVEMAVEQIERIKRGHFERNLTSWKCTPTLCPAWNMCHNIVEQPEESMSLHIV